MTLHREKILDRKSLRPAVLTLPLAEEQCKESRRSNLRWLGVWRLKQLESKSLCEWFTRKMGEREDFLASETRKSRGCATIVIEFLYARASNENVDSWSSRPFSERRSHR